MLKTYFLVFFILCFSISNIFADVVADGGATTLGTIVSAPTGVVDITGGTTAGSNLFHSFTNFTPVNGDTVTFTTANGLVLRDITAAAKTLAGAFNSSSAVDFTYLSSNAVTLGPNLTFDDAEFNSLTFGASSFVRSGASQFFSNTGADTFTTAPERIGGTNAALTLDSFNQTLSGTGNILSFMGSTVNVNTSTLTGNNIFFGADSNDELNVTTGALVDSTGNAVVGDRTFTSNASTYNVLNNFVLRSGNASFVGANTIARSNANTAATVTIVSGANLDLQNTDINASFSIANPGTVSSINLTAQGNMDLGNTTNTTDSDLYVNNTTGWSSGNVTLTSNAGNITFHQNSDIFGGSNTAVNITATAGGVFFNNANVIQSSSGTINIIGNGNGDGQGISISNAPNFINTNSNVNLSSNNGGIAIANSDMNASGNINLTSFNDITLNNSELESYSNNIVIRFQNNASSISGVTLTNNGRLYADNGTVDVLAPGAINLTNSQIYARDYILLNSQNLGISGVGSQLRTTDSFTSGAIDLVAELDITFTNSVVSTRHDNNVASAGNIRIEATRDVIFDNTDVLADTDGINGGNVYINTDALNPTSGGGVVTFQNGSIISTSSTGTGTAGNVRIEANRQITFIGESDIETMSSNVSGSVSIRSYNEGILFNDAYIMTHINDGTTTGIGGDVNLTAYGDIEFQNTAQILTNGRVSGDVTINSTDNDVIFNNGYIGTYSDYLTPGKVDIYGKTSVQFTGSNINASIYGGNGTGGTIEIDSPGRIFFTASNIRTQALSTQGNVVTGLHGGSVLINTTTNNNGDVEFSNSDIFTSSNYGNGGLVDIRTSGEIYFHNGSDINTQGLVQSGEVKIAVEGSNDIIFESNSNIDTSTTNANSGIGGKVTISTKGGDVEFNASSIKTSGGTTSGAVEISAINDDVNFVNSSINTNSANGTSGTVSITVKDTISFEGTNGGIGIRTGALGNVSLITAEGDIDFLNSNINTSSTGANAGNVLLDAKTEITFNNSNITAENSGTGNGGNVTVDTEGTISFTNSAISTQGTNVNALNGGKVTITTTGSNEQVTFSGSTINTSTISDTGNAGDVMVSAPGVVSFTAGSNITTNSKQTSGKVQITSTTNNVVFNASVINTQSTTGVGGLVTINAQGEIQLLAAANIFTGGADVSGKVTLNSQSNVNIDGSNIDTSAATKVGGDIEIDANGTVLLNNADLVTSVTGGNNGNAGWVDIDATGNVTFTNDSNIVTTVNNTGINGGNVNVKTDGAILFEQASNITTSGTIQGGQVDLEAAGAVTFTGASHIVTNSTIQAGGVEITSTTAGIAFTDTNIQAQGSNANNNSVGGNVIITTKATGGAGTVGFNNSQISTTGYFQGGKVDIDSTGVVTFENASHITTNASVDAGDVVVTGRNANINFTNSNINAQSTLSGDGGKVTITSTTGDVTFTTSDINASGILAGGAVKVNATGTVTFTTSSDITTNATNDAGNVNVQTTGAIVFTASNISAISTTNGTSGQVLLQTTTGNVGFGNNSDINTSNTGNGDGGLVQVFSGGQISFIEGSDILTNAQSANSTSGVVNVTSFFTGNQAILFDNSDINTSATNATADTVVTGGEVRINAVTGEVRFNNNADIITSGNSDDGVSGQVRINSNAITFQGTSTVNTSSTGLTGGAVIFNASGLVNFNTNSEIVTSANATSGSVSITAGQVGFNQAFIDTTSAGATGAAGSVTINCVGNIDFSNTASITTSAFTAGKVTLNSSNGAVNFNNADIFTSTTTGTVAAGEVEIDAKTDISFTDSSIDARMLGTGTGNGGKVDIYAGRNIAFLNSTIDTTSVVSGNNGGEVWVRTTGGTLGFNNSTISSGTAGTGNGGRVDIKATGQITFQAISDINTTSNQTSGLVRVESSASGVNFNDSEINTSSAGGAGIAGTVTVLASGEVRFQANSNINAGANTGAMVTLTSNNDQVWFTSSTITTNGNTAANVDINARTNVMFETNSNINAGLNANATTGGDVTIDATTGTVTFNQSTIFAQGSNEAGDVTVNAYNTVTFINAAHINANSTTGDAGDVTINSTNDAVAFTNSTITTGRLGNVNVDAMQNITFVTNSNISTQSATGQGGNVTLDSTMGDITFTASTITSTGSAADLGGTIAINAFGEINFSSVSDITTGGRGTATTMVSVQSVDGGITFDNSEIVTGNFGNVVINAPDAVDFSNGSHITTTAANAGTVTIRSTTNDVLFDSSNITTGTAGNVSLWANRDVVFTTADIVTTSGVGNAGTVTVLADTGDVDFLDSNISTNVTAGAGNAGTVSIETDGSGQSVLFDSSAINTANAGTGVGGNVTISAPGSVEFSALSNITTTANAGNSGTVTVQSQSSFLSFTNSAITTGMGGTVDVDASMNISFLTNANIDTRSTVGQGANVTIDSVNGTVTFTQSTIRTSGSTGTTGGTVAINAPGTIQFTNVSDITTGGRATSTNMVVVDSSNGSVLFNNSKITTGSFGNVSIEARNDVQFAAASNIRTQDGQGGNVSVVSQTSFVDFNASTINTSGTTHGGSVTVNAPGAINFTAASHITTGSETVLGGVVNITSTTSTVNLTNSDITTGQGGNINILAQAAVTLNNAEVAAESVNNGANVVIQSQGDVLNFTNSFVSSTSTGAGLAGTITLTSPTTITLDNTEVYAESVDGNGNTITINASNAFIQNGSEVTSFSENGNGGIVDLNVTNSLTITNSDVYADGGTQGGQIMIDAANLNITGSEFDSTGGGLGVIDINITNVNNIATLQDSDLFTNTLHLRGRFNALNGGDGVELSADTVHIYNRLTSRGDLTITGTARVEQNAELRSSGLVVGTLNNLGRVAPEDFGNNNIADLRVNGTFMNGATGTLEINLTTNAANHDRVVVTGNINLNNRLELLFNPNDVYLQGTTFDIIPFTGTRTGEFTWYHGINNEAINPNLPLLRFRVRYMDDLDQVQVYVHRSFFERIEFTDPRAEALATSLEPIANGGGGDDLMNNILPVLDRMTAAEVQSALVQMGSESFDGLALHHFQNTGLFTSALLGQLQGVGYEASQETNTAHSRMSNMIMLAYEGDVKTLGATQEEPQSSSSGKSIDVFVQFLGSMGDQDSVTGERTGFDYQTMGFVAGINFIASDSVKLGLHGAYTMTDIDFDDIGDSDAETTSMYFGVHANMKSENLFFSVLMGYAFSNYEKDRHIVLPGIDRTATSDFDGHSFYGTLSAGYDFEFGEGLVFTPVTSLNYVYQQIEKVKEKNAGDLNLTIDDHDVDSFRMGLGFRLAYRIKSETVSIVPEMRFMWLHEFLNDSDELETVLAGNPNNPAYIPTADPERNLFRLGAQISAYLTDSFLMKFEYDAELQKDYVSHLGKVSLSISF